MYLTVEIVAIILEYGGHIQNRAGKYMKQLDLNDSKYNDVKENMEIKSRIVQEVKKKRILSWIEIVL